MLSPHEFAALLLIAGGHDLRQLDPYDLDSLVEHQLLALEQMASGSGSFRLTADGDSIIRAVVKTH